jgi:hypothetical protein
VTRGWPTPAAAPPLARFAAAGAAGLGVVGGVVGLIVGLVTYAPTAPFAVVEIGLPAAVVGAVLGVVVGAVLLAIRPRSAQERSHRP